MPFQITDPELESDLDRHAKMQPVPTTKGRMFIAIARAVIAAADARHIHAGTVIEELREVTQTAAAEVSAA